MRHICTANGRAYGILWLPGAAAPSRAPRDRGIVRCAGTTTSVSLCSTRIIFCPPAHSTAIRPSMFLRVLPVCQWLGASRGQKVEHRNSNVACRPCPTRPNSAPRTKQAILKKLSQESLLNFSMQVYCSMRRPGPLPRSGSRTAAVVCRASL